MSGNIFEIIKSIQKINRKILPHTEKNLLISIAIHLGNNEHIWATNQQMSERIGESKDYVKNIVMRLKRKQFIKIKGRHKERKIYLNEAKIFGNSQLPKHENGKIFSYQEYLKSEEWKRIRKKVLKKFDWSCGVCKSKNDLHVHHKTYENIGNELKHLKDLIVLCSNCHSLFHSKLKEGEK